MIPDLLRRRPFWGKVVVVVSGLLLLSLLFSSETFTDIASADEPISDELFSESDLQEDSLTPDPSLIRARYVEINFDLLGGQDGPPLDGSGLGKRLPLNLFDDSSFTAVMDRLEQNPSGSYTWIGHLAGVEYSQVILVVNDELMVGHVSAPGELYDIRYIDEGVHAIAEIDPAATNAEGNDAIEVKLPSESGAPAVVSASDDGSVIDIMIVYSDDAVAASTAATIQGWIELFMAYTNQAYVNSGINQRVALVHTQEVTYNETGQLGQDLPALKNGDVANVHALRDTYHADLVMLLVNNGDGGNTGSCGGLAYLQTSVTSGFQSNGFSVMEACSFGSSVFAHELGHNMGARHDWFEDGGPTAITPYTYAHGYVDTTNRFRTIMAYNNHCGVQGFSCGRIDYFSNPDINYNGNPTGVAEGTSTSCTENNTGNPDCDADVRKTLNNTAANTSGFRSSEVVWTGATSSDWNTASNWSMDQGVPGSTSTVNRVPRSIDNVRIPAGTPNSPTISANADVRNLLIESGATLDITAGTLNVYGDWEEQGTAQTNSSGGTVLFKSNLDQSIQTNSNTSFNDVQIGDSTTQKVTLNSDLDINGNLTLKSGATLAGGSQTINLAGNWDDEANGFDFGTSTVIFDGTSQTADKVTTSTLLTEDFNRFTGCCSTARPSGWAREQADGFGFATGEFVSGNGSAVRWNDTTDAWLITSAFALQPGITYEVEYKYATSGGTSDFRVYAGTTQSSSSMLSGTLVHTAAGVSSSSYQTATATFTVPSAGNYYIGFRNQRVSSGGFGLLDDIVLRAKQNITFYNLTNDSDSVTFSKDVAVNNDLLVNASKVMDLSTNSVTVEGSVSNSGSLQQSQDVSTNGTTYEFLTIKNAAGSSTKYYGVNITPDGGSGLGSTSVRIDGSQSCTSNAGDGLVQRCFNITPTSSNSATIKYWYSEAERNSQSANALKVWDWNSSAWTLVGTTASYGESGASCAADASCWAQWTSISTFSPMVLGSGSTPTGNPGGSTVATPTPTPTNTPTNTPTATNTPTPTPTNTAVPATNTPTATNTAVPPTNTPTATNTAVPPTATNTVVPPTNTPTATNTAVPATNTPTVEPATNTPTVEPATNTPTMEPATNTPTVEPATNTPTVEPATNTPTVEPATNTPTVEPATNTPTPTNTAEPATNTPTPTNTAEPDINTPTATATATATATPAAPVVTSIDPVMGRNNFANEINIYGNNFQQDSVVSIDGNQATDLATTFVSATHLRAVIPAGQEVGLYDVIVTNPGANPATLSSAYTVLAAESDDLFGKNYQLLTSPSPVRAGDSAQISFVVQRQGGSETLSDVAVHFYLGNPNSGGTLIGTGTVALLAANSSGTTNDVAWSVPEAGSYRIFAVIDPDNQVSEAAEDNNMVSRRVRVLPAASDTTRPTIDDFTINGGASQTTDQTVELSISASDPGEPSTGVQWVYLIEYEFNQNAGRWVPAQRPGWQSYESALEWTLLPSAGVKYLQAWVADGAGNISRPRVAMINHLPASDTLARGSSRFYIYQLNAGQSMSATVTPSSGDPDLYVWSPQAGTSWNSINFDLAVDEVSLTAPVDGIYIVEVYAYQASQYNLTVGMGTTINNTATRSSLSPALSRGGKTPQAEPGLAADDVPEEQEYALPVAEEPDEPTAVTFDALEASQKEPTTLFSLFVVGLFGLTAYLWRRERTRTQS